MRLNRRVADLETKLAPSGPAAWVQVIQELGQTQEEALAAYEAHHGPIGESSVIMRVIV
jgi:hypothetical protein